MLQIFLNVWRYTAKILKLIRALTEDSLEKNRLKRSSQKSGQLQKQQPGLLRAVEPPGCNSL